jgi:fructokinase
MHLRRVDGDGFEGICPYHGACWEGLCSGPAMEARTGVKAEKIPADDPAWVFEAHYVGQALANIVLVLSPERIIVGGSVRKAGRRGEKAFFADVRKQLQDILNRYVVAEQLTSAIDGYVVPPDLGDDAGVLGAIALAQEALAS